MHLKEQAKIIAEKTLLAKTRVQSLWSLSNLPEVGIPQVFKDELQALEADLHEVTEALHGRKT